MVGRHLQRSSSPNSFKVERFRLDFRRNFFTMRTVKHCNSSLIEVAQPPFTEVFRLDLIKCQAMRFDLIAYLALNMNMRMD